MSPLAVVEPLYVVTRFLGELPRPWLPRACHYGLLGLRYLELAGDQRFGQAVEEPEGDDLAVAERLGQRVLHRSGTYCRPRQLGACLPLR